MLHSSLLRLVFVSVLIFLGRGVRLSPLDTSAINTARPLRLGSLLSRYGYNFLNGRLAHGVQGNTEQEKGGTHSCPERDSNPRTQS
jgi:hypothetical protein